MTDSNIPQMQLKENERKKSGQILLDSCSSIINLSSLWLDEFTKPERHASVAEFRAFDSGKFRK